MEYIKNQSRSQLPAPSPPQSRERIVPADAEIRINSGHNPLTLGYPRKKTEIKTVKHWVNAAVKVSDCLPAQVDNGQWTVDNGQWMHSQY